MSKLSNRLYPVFESFKEFGHWYKDGGMECARWHQILTFAEIVEPWTIHAVFDNGREVLFPIFELLDKDIIEYEHVELLRDLDFFYNKMHYSWFDITWCDHPYDFQEGDRYVSLGASEYIYYNPGCYEIKPPNCS